MKKLLLSLALFAAVSTPVAAVASCGTKEKTQQTTTLTGGKHTENDNSHVNAPIKESVKIIKKGTGMAASYMATVQLTKSKQTLSTEDLDHILTIIEGAIKALPEGEQGMAGMTLSSAIVKTPGKSFVVKASSALEETHILWLDPSVIAITTEDAKVAETKEITSSTQTNQDDKEVIEFQLSGEETGINADGITEVGLDAIADKLDKSLYTSINASKTKIIKISEDFFADVLRTFTATFEITGAKTKAELKELVKANLSETTQEVAPGSEFDVTSQEVVGQLKADGTMTDTKFKMFTVEVMANPEYVDTEAQFTTRKETTAEKDYRLFEDATSTTDLKDVKEITSLRLTEEFAGKIADALLEQLNSEGLQIEGETSAHPMVKVSISLPPVDTTSYVDGSESTALQQRTLVKEFKLTSILPREQLILMIRNIHTQGISTENIVQRAD